MAKSKMKSDEWGTPDQIYNLLPRGSYFDPCPFQGQAIEFNKTNRWGQEVVIWRDGRMFPQIDGLLENWGSNSFVNPPFSDIEPWILKGYKEWDQHGNRSVIVLPSHTDREWFRRSVQPRQFHVVWTKRIQYIPLTGQKVSQPQFGTGLLMIGHEPSVVNLLISASVPELGPKRRKARAKRTSETQSQPLPSPTHSESATS